MDARTDCSFPTSIRTASDSRRESHHAIAVTPLMATSIHAMSAPPCRRARKSGVLCERVAGAIAGSVRNRRATWTGAVFAVKRSPACTRGPGKFSYPTRKFSAVAPSPGSKMTRSGRSRYWHGQCVGCGAKRMAARPLALAWLLTAGALVAPRCALGQSSATPPSDVRAPTDARSHHGRRPSTTRVTHQPAIRAALARVSARIEEAEDTERAMAPTIAVP